MFDWILDLVYSLALGCLASVSLVVALGFGLATLFDPPDKEQPYDVIKEAEQVVQELHKQKLHKKEQEEEKS